MEKSYLRKVTRSKNRGDFFSINIPAELSRKLRLDGCFVEIKCYGGTMVMTKIEYDE